MRKRKPPMRGRRRGNEPLPGGRRRTDPPIPGPKLAKRYTWI